MKPTKEQIKELLQWCGIQCYYKDEANDDIEAWICPPDSEKTVAFYGLTLDFLFKYALPKSFELDYKKTYMALLRWITDYANYVGIREADEEPALALFWAIYKVIK